jgi:hypothetical protein
MRQGDIFTRSGRQDRDRSVKHKAYNLAWMVAGGGDRWGRSKIARLRSWGFFPRAIGSHSRFLNKKERVSDVDVGITPWGLCGEQTGREMTRSQEAQEKAEAGGKD